MYAFYILSEGINNDKKFMRDAFHAFKYLDC